MRQQGKGIPLDREALHAFLFRKSDRLHRIVLNQRALADDLGIHEVSMSHIVKELVLAGRLRPIGHRTFVVADPEKWKAWQATL